MMGKPKAILCRQLNSHSAVNPDLSNVVTSPNQSKTAEVVDLSHDGRGVVKLDGQVIFVAGALPGETVRFLPMKKRRGQVTGRLLEVVDSSPHRVVPRCEYFGVCGGCTLQHLESEQQLVLKQKILFDNLLRIGHVEPEKVLPPLNGPVWHYRRKARPGVKLVPKKGGVLVGFREQGSSYLTSLRHCHTLDERLSRLLDPLHTLVAGLSCSNQIPQIEMAVGESDTALVVRHLQPLTRPDLDALILFAKEYEAQIHLQSGGPKTVTALYPEAPEMLTFELPGYAVTLKFTALDFIQVNAAVNESMIDQALSWLQPSAGDRVLDLFCGLGNFTLPIARSGAEVLGVEGEESLVARARDNAARNGLDNAQFEAMDLQREGVEKLGATTPGRQPFNKLLLDPPRSGALQVVTELLPAIMPQTIVYISCNPATLARDAEVLVNNLGFRFVAAGAIDMFPHTAHVESMAVFSQ